MQPTVAANYIAIDQNKDPKNNLKKIVCQNIVDSWLSWAFGRPR